VRRVRRKSINDTVTPRSYRHEDVTAMYILGQKYPHIYTLSINIGKNKSTNVCGALYIPTYAYSYKVITRCDTILQVYYITDRRKCEYIKRYTIMNSTKRCSRVTKGKLVGRTGGLEGWGSGQSTADP